MACLCEEMGGETWWCVNAIDLWHDWADSLLDPVLVYSNLWKALRQ